MRLMVDIDAHEMNKFRAEQMGVVLNINSVLSLLLKHPLKLAISLSSI